MGKTPFEPCVRSSRTRLTDEVSRRDIAMPPGSRTVPRSGGVAKAEEVAGPVHVNLAAPQIGGIVDNAVAEPRAWVRQCLQTRTGTGDE